MSTQTVVAGLLVGLLIGLALGALGGGGSILAVPALVYALHQDPRTATTGSLLLVGLTSLVALVPHARAGRVRFGKGLSFGVLGTAGSVVGALTARHLPAHVLLAAFAVLMLVVAALMLHRSRRRPAADAAQPADTRRSRIVSMRPWRCDCPRAARVLAAATVVGLLTGFFGVGGGFLLVPALVLALSFPMPVAVGTSLLVIAVNSATGLLARTAGDGPRTAVDGTAMAAVGLLTVAAVIGSLFGQRLTAAIEPRRLTRAFAVLLVAVAGYALARTAGTRP